MVTFTVPAALRPVFLREPKIMIDRLFQAAAGALQEVAAMPRHLGAELGMIGVLHTLGAADAVSSACAFYRARWWAQGGWGQVA